MDKAKERETFAINRREFLELSLASNLLPSTPGRISGAQQSNKAVSGPSWMNEQPLVISMTWVSPLYVRRVGGFAPWQIQEWYSAYTEPAAKELKKLGVTAVISPIFLGYGLDVEWPTIEEIKKGAAFWRRYGIKVGTYIGSTIHYETFLLERPEAEEWLVPDYLGVPVIYGNIPDRRWPYFMHPGFREYIKEVIRVGIEDVKTDLFLFDHTSMQAQPEMFQHPMAIEDFRNFLRSRYTPEELKPWLGTSDVRYVVPPKVHWPLEHIDNRLFQEWMDFRCRMLARYYEEMAAYIHSLNPSVGIITNPHRGLSGINTMWYEGVDYPRLIPHMQAAWSEEGDYPDVTSDGILVSEIRTYKMASILGARTVTYTGIPYVGLPPDEKHMQLQMAQAMAYGRQCLGDVGPVFYSPKCKLPEGARKYIRFFHDRFDLYRDVESAADVAVLHSYASLAYNNDRPYQSTYLYEQALIQNQIPFDIIFDEHLKDLSKYRVLVLADQECLNKKQCDLIRRFVQGGGGLVATEFTSLFTSRHVRRRDYELADLFQVPAPEFVMFVKEKPLAIGPVRHAVSGGRVVYVAEVKPAIEKPPGEAMTSRYWKLPANTEELIKAVQWAGVGNLMLEVEAPITVTANLLRQRKSGALQIHLVNYDMGRNPRVDNIQMRVRVAEGTHHVRIFSPDQNEIMTAEGEMQEGRLEFKLPALEVYSVVDIR